ncbi:hypothetical protein CSKR_108893 [Clonorchis sinensis]|uniref:Uncharacterized protein n=1 Tax=Clonorchis sinensis TaxID=79923 RepID=A0A3R7JGV9_CLOSI|nr:hypothetical protein CSKR_108893 [Clonorchis sinensis]
MSEAKLEYHKREMVVGLSAELGNLIANVPSSVEVTSSARSAHNYGAKGSETVAGLFQLQQIKAVCSYLRYSTFSKKCLTQEIQSFANQFGFAKYSPGTQLNLPLLMSPSN